MILTELGHSYVRRPHEGALPLFDELLEILRELLLHSSGDIAEALSWLSQLDEEHHLTNDEYGIADFIDELEERGYMLRSGDLMQMTNKLEANLRRTALDEIFGRLKVDARGSHKTDRLGRGDERTSDLRGYSYGDAIEQIALTESLQNAQRRGGFDQLDLQQDDLRVYETYRQTRMSTVLLIDISHSMILYGEDRITPAKKVAMAMSELIMTRYPQDTLDVVTFGDDAQRVEVKDLPYLWVGPYHTNTVAGLEMAMSILKKKKNNNKQIIMITDGKPSCIRKGSKLYKNPYGLDRQIIKRTMVMAKRCRDHQIPVTTFMIARDPLLMEFVQRFTEVNGGKAYYAALDQLGSLVFQLFNQKKSR